MMITLIAPALCAGLAIHLAAARTNHGKGGIRPCDQVIPAWLPWFLAIVACVGHMCRLATDKPVLSISSVHVRCVSMNLIPIYKLIWRALGSLGII